jgi:thiol-disulfide isomerase/thioredoxin
MCVLIAGVLITMTSCQLADPNPNEVVEVLKEYSELQSRLDSDKNKLWIVNFWATTCPPCLKEMPHFKELQKELQGKDVKILLVSLDRSKDLDSRVYPFIEKHAIVPEVVLLEDQNYSAWTDEIDPSWYGALPATVIIKGETRKFRMGIYHTLDELRDDVHEVMGD